MERRWCNACGDAFLPRPQSPRQTYCIRDGCQRERKRLWQLVKRKGDPDYLENQLVAQRAWSKRNPDYWRAYRTDHPAYVESNRTKQRTRNQREGLIAKMDVSSEALPEGIYRIVLLAADGTRTDEEWIVRLVVVTVQTSS